MDYLLDPVRVAEIRPGFAPSRLLEYDESERPIAGRVPCIAVTNRLRGKPGSSTAVS